MKRISIGNSMVSSAIWKKTCTSEFFKDDRNCTSPKDECNLKPFKTSRVYVFHANCTHNFQFKVQKNSEKRSKFTLLMPDAMLDF